jgi:transcriptional regulator with XRE-family HTH domain/SOS-response transcriptional repressor LexA
MDVAEKLKEFRLSSGKSQQEFASVLGIAQKTWSNYENGQTQPPMKVLFALAEKGYIIDGLTSNFMDDWPDEKKQEFHRRMKIVKAGVFPPGMPLDDVARIIEAVDNHPKTMSVNSLKLYHTSDLPEGSFVVPLLEQRLSAGPGAVLPEEDEAKALIRVPGYLARYGENVAALEVDGDSMEPTLRRGDMVVCDSCGWSGEGIYAVRMGGSGFVKRITKRPGKVVVLSDNPKYPPQEESEESEDFAIIGRVHCAITKVE